MTQNQLSRSEALAEQVLQSHFTLVPGSNGIAAVDVTGASGWTSPENPHPVLSLIQWTTQDPDVAEAALDEVLAAFQAKARGFDWMTGPATEHLVPLLYQKGFIDPPLEVSAMVRNLANEIPVPALEGLRIWQVEDASDPRIYSVMASGFDVPDDVGKIYHDAYMTPSSLQKTEVFAVSTTGDDTPVAVGYLSYIGDGSSALLRVSSTLESHRGRGIYHALVMHRLQQAANAGFKEAFVHAYSQDSRQVLGHLGFEEAGRLHLHRWRP